jgi:eukaryotic-like serine/threonine-protein kinase
MTGFQFDGEIDEKLCLRACAELRRRLRAGGVCSAEEVFAGCPGLGEQADFAVEVIYTEFVATEELGHGRPPEAWYWRFPQFRDRLERLFQVHAQLGAITPPEISSGQPRDLREKHVAGYEILEELGRGGMGVVYLARQSQLGRLVAIKMVLAGAHADPLHANRFLAEAKAVARLHHPNIVQIFEVGEHEGCPFLALEYVEGGSLDKHQHGEPLAQQVAAALVETLARAIHHAHENGIVHRDLKPANILLQKVDNRQHTVDSRAMVERAGTSETSNLPTGYCLLTTVYSPKITDFGLAKDLADENGLTRTGAVLGTPSYMAPEQARGGNQGVGPRTDVYSLGAILYELLTGRPPFKGDSAMEILEQVRHLEPISVRRLQPKIAQDLETITHKCLNKEPGHRYGTALALAEDLARFLADEPIRARPVSSMEQVIRWCRRQPALASALAALIVVFLCGFVGVAWKWRDALNEGSAKEQALRHEISERQGKELALIEAHTNLYFQQVALADREWSDNNVGNAERLLNNCPPELRQWEWYYMRGLCKSGLLKLHINDASRVFLQFQPDGECLGLSVDSNRASFWNVSTGLITGSWPGLLRWQGLVPCTREGRMAPYGREGIPTFAVLVVNGPKQELREGVHGALITDLPNLQNDEEPVTISHKGRTLLTHSRTEKLLRIRATDSGNELRRLPSQADIGQGNLSYNRDWYKRIRFSPDDRQLAVIMTKVIQIWDLDKGVLRASLRPTQGGSINCLCYRPDGQKLAAGSSECGITIWDTSSLQEERTLVGHTYDVLTLDYSPEGRHLASAGLDRSVRVWDVDEGTLYRYFRGHSKPVTLIGFSADGQKLASVDMDCTARIWSVSQPQDATVLLGHSDCVMAVAFAPDGGQLLTAGLDSAVRVWDARAGTYVRTDGRRGFVHRALAYRPDGALYAVGGDERVVRLYSRGGEEMGALTGHEDSVRGLAFSKDIKRLASAAFDGTVRIWDLQSGRALHTLREKTAYWNAVAYSSDGALLGAAGSGGNVVLWNAETGAKVASLEKYHHPATCLAFHPDGKSLAVAHENGSIVLWDMASHTVIREFEGHGLGVFGLAFDRAGARLFSCSGDQTVKVWETATGIPALTLQGHRFLVSALALSPDNQVLASAGADRTIRLWRAGRP